MINYTDIQILVRGEYKPAKMQAGTSFENKSKIYTIKKDGTFSVFDKSSKISSKADYIEMTRYQYNAFCAVADNNDEQAGEVILSRKDIDSALNMDKKGLVKDIKSKLGGYKVQNPILNPNDKKFSVYISNGNKCQSGKLEFGYIPAPFPVYSGAFTGIGIFNDKNIVEYKSGMYSVKPGESIVDIARKFDIDTYQIIAANPQLKEGEDYCVNYISEGINSGTSQMESYFYEGQRIRIPSRYSVKKGSVKSLSDVAKITGLSEHYIVNLLTKVEANGPELKSKYLTTYPDPTGIPTIAYGHTGRYKGKPLLLDDPVTITREDAYELLANDILKHKAMLMAYLGEMNYKNAPKSLQDALFDIAYNKGIYNGFLHTGGYCEETSKIKCELAAKDYVSVLVHTRRTKTGLPGLRKRNLYRFVIGLADLSQDQQNRAINAMTPYYNEVLGSRKGRYDEKSLINLWNNAKKGKTTNIIVK